MISFASRKTPSANLAVTLLLLLAASLSSLLPPASACSRELHSTVETYNRGDIRRMPVEECGRLAEQASEDSIKKETKVREADESTLQRQIEDIVTKSRVDGSSIQLGTASKMDKTSETRYKWSTGKILWNVELRGCTASDIIVKEGDCLPLINNPFRRLASSERHNRRSLLCSHGNKNNGHCSAKVKCTYRAFTNDLNGKCEAPAPPPSPTPTPTPAAKTTEGNNGLAVILTKDQDCNIFTPCAAPLTCKLTEGLSFCVLPIFGKCKCQ